MTFSPDQFIPYLCDSNLPERVEAVRGRSGDAPDMQYLLGFLADDTEVICTHCFHESRDLLLSSPAAEARATLNGAMRHAKQRWAAEGAERSEDSSYVARRGKRAMKIKRKLTHDGALAPGARDLSSSDVDRALRVSASRLWSDPWRSRAVLELADIEVIAEAIRGRTGEVVPTQVAHVLRAAHRIGDGPWVQELYETMGCLGSLEGLDEALEYERANRLFEFRRSCAECR